MIIEYSNREILFKIQWNLYIFVVILRNLAELGFIIEENDWSAYTMLYLTINAW